MEFHLTKKIEKRLGTVNVRQNDDGSVTLEVVGKHPDFAGKDPEVIGTKLRQSILTVHVDDDGTPEINYHDNAFDGTL
jgi:hypothetical protein